MRSSKNLLLLVTLALSLTGNGFSQEWAASKPFHSLTDGFTVEGPANIAMRGGLGPKDGRKYQGSANGVWFYVFSDPVSDPRLIGTIKSFVEASGHKLDIGSGPEAPFAVTFTDGFNYTHRIEAFNLHGRIMVLQVIYQADQGGIAERFIRSFKDGIPPSMHPNVSPTANTTDRSAERPMTKLGPASGYGYGQGSGSGSGGISTGPANPPKNVTESPLRILSKPRPSYTDLARFYEISGTVITRVRFDADGTVGAVEVARGLPFGLNDSAIKAAKGMSFEPATSDGKPVSVAKLVEYTFAIF